MKRILVVTDLDMKRFDSGTEFYFRFLKECIRNNIYVEFVVPTEPCNAVKDKLKETNFAYTVIRNWWNRKNIAKRNNVRISFDILKIIRKKRFDLVAFNFCDEITAFLVALISSLLFCKPKIVWHQHCEIEEINSEYSIKKFISKLMILSFFIDLICPVFKKQEAVLISRGIEKEKILTLYNGINISRFDQSVERAVFLKELGIRRDCKIVVTIASLIERKGLEYFLRAASMILKCNPQTEFLIVGAGPLLDQLKNLSRQLQTDNNVHFLGIRDDVHRILNIADIFVLASLAEPFGLVNTEAMAAKKPVVATRVGGIPEIVEHNLSGFLIPSKDYIALSERIIELLNNEKLSMEMGLKGRKIVEERFSIEAMVKNYVNAYNKLLFCHA